MRAGLADHSASPDDPSSGRETVRPTSRTFGGDYFAPLSVFIGRNMRRGNAVTAGAVGTKVADA